MKRPLDENAYKGGLVWKRLKRRWELHNRSKTLLLGIFFVKRIVLAVYIKRVQTDPSCIIILNTGSKYSYNSKFDLNNITFTILIFCTRWPKKAVHIPVTRDKRKPLKINDKLSIEKAKYKKKPNGIETSRQISVTDYRKKFYFKMSFYSKIIIHISLNISPFLFKPFNYLICLICLFKL